MPYKDIKDMTSDELLEFKAYIDSESAKVKDQLMVAKSTGAATGQYLPIPEYANLLSKKSYYAKKSQQIQTLMGRKKKLEKQERGIVGAELVIANLKAENARLRQNVDTVEQQSARIAELEARLAETQERNQNNIMNAESRMERLQAEIARLREGGCAREQGATQYCAEAQRLAGDAAILDWIADHEVVNDVDGVNLDIHDIARKIVDNQGRQKQSTIQIYRQALRQLIRAAMDEKRNDDSGL
jgi:small-conductance mechanosensitive channel